MFSSKKCKSCGKKIKDEWEFCPHCGEEISEEGDFPKEDIFSDIEDEFRRIDKMFGSDFFNFPKIDMKPSGGISIIISSGLGKEPRVEVRTPSGYKSLEPEIKKKLGVASSVAGQKTIRVPKVTEEPETSVQSSENKKTISIKLPDVKSEDDIDIRKLEQSIEVKAFANKKAYFTLVPIPSNFSITNKKFKNNILTIEAGKRS